MNLINHKLKSTFESIQVFPSDSLYNHIKDEWNSEFYQGFLKGGDESQLFAEKLHYLDAADPLIGSQEQSNGIIGRLESKHLEVYK